MLRRARRLQPLTCRALLDSTTCRRHSSHSARQHDPLNILFCAADEFSIYSLRALSALQSKRPEKIAAIDVVCRPDKRVGRGLKQIHEVPIKSVANELGLKLHQIDTFKGWSPPQSINLIVAVSFGLLVPARILDGAKYGGLNVHPSMLPDLRGSAPIIHTLLKQRSHTGVTLQTMHPTKFDHGTILAQTPAPGIHVPPDCRTDLLLSILGPLGAQMLCEGVENGLFLPPVRDIRKDKKEPTQLDHAPKITPEDRHINWSTWTSDEIILRNRVLGRLWDVETYKRCTGGDGSKRIAFEGPWLELREDAIESAAQPSNYPGQPVLVYEPLSKYHQLGIRTVDGKVLLPTAATIDGERKGTGVNALIKRLSMK